MGLSGAVLFVLPGGVRLLGLDKGALKDLHMVFMVPFLVAAILHCVWNWKAIVSHCKPARDKREAARVGVAAVALFSIVLLVGTLARVSPITDFLAWGHALSHGTQGPGPGGLPPTLPDGQGGRQPGAGQEQGTPPGAAGGGPAIQDPQR